MTDDSARQSALALVLARMPEIRFAYLFGSRAQRRARPDSDWDIAVWTGLASVEARAALREHLFEQLMAIVPADRLDLIVLDDAPLLLAYEALRTGRLLDNKDPGARVSYVVRTLQRYFDEEHARRIWNEALHERVLEGKGAWSTAA